MLHLPAISQTNAKNLSGHLIQRNVKFFNSVHQVYRPPKLWDPIQILQGGSRSLFVLFSFTRLLLSVLQIGCTTSKLLFFWRKKSTSAAISKISCSMGCFSFAQVESRNVDSVMCCMTLNFQSPHHCHMHCMPVRIAVHRHGAYSHLPCSAHHPASYLSSVGNEDLFYPRWQGQGKRHKSLVLYITLRRGLLLILVTKVLFCFDYIPLTHWCTTHRAWTP